MMNSDPAQINISDLECAASVLMSSGQVTPEQRREAENYLMQLKKVRAPQKLFEIVVEHSCNDIVLFHVTGALKEGTLREWSVLPAETIQQTVNQLLTCVCHNYSRYAQFVVCEMLQSVCMMFKRSTFDGKAGDPSALFDYVTRLVSSDNTGLQCVACQLLHTLCTEYCTAWRSSNVGLTWDFHVRAKRQFEETNLKRVLIICLEVLHATILKMKSKGTKADNDVLMCGRLLSVAELVLSWHFGMRLLPRRLTFSIEFSAAICLRPPDSWQDIFSENKVTQFFFMLHGLLEDNPELSHRSMQCLIQLAGISPSLFPTYSIRKSYDLFFVQQILQLFGVKGPPAHDVYNCCLLINRLLTHRSLADLYAMPPEILEGFITFLAKLTEQVCAKSINIEMVCDETKYHEAFVKLLDCWVILVRSEGALIPEGTFGQPAQHIFSCYLRQILAPPDGLRPMVDNDMVVNELEDDDRDQHCDVLCDVGVLARHSINTTINILQKCILRKLSAFESLMVSNVDAHNGDMINWHEDMHWILLLIGFIFTGEDCDLRGFIHSDLLVWSKTWIKLPDLQGSRDYLQNCIENPTNSTGDNVHPIIKLLGFVFIWASIENELMKEKRGALLSPQLTCTTLWCVRRVLSAYSCVAPERVTFTCLDDSPHHDNSPVASSESDGLEGVLETGTQLSRVIVRFVIDKCFTCLKWCSAEEGTVNDALALLASVANERPRAEELVHSENLLANLCETQLASLSSNARKSLLRTLVIVGAASQDESIQEQLYRTVLDPLKSRFSTLMVANPNSNQNWESELVDLIDCLCGVCQGALNHSAKVIFDFVMPVLEECTPLLETSRDRQLIVDAVLNLFNEATQRLLISHLESEQAHRLYAAILKLLNLYACHQTNKYSNCDIEEDKASDLSLVINILTNILTKDLILFSAVSDRSDISTVAQVCLLGLDTLMPIMSAELLKFPTLSLPYFRLLLLICELYPAEICAMPEHMINNLLKSSELGISSEYGNEVVRHTLDMLNVLGLFTCQSNEAYAPHIKIRLGAFIKPVFELCLNTSSEVDVFSDAAVALYSLVCCNKEEYFNFVSTLLNNVSDEDNRNKLRDAFQTLLPPHKPIEPLRRERRAFKERFETTFLNDIQGLLFLNT